MKILITGGHPAPALAFIDYVLAHNPQIQLVFAGRKYGIDSERSHSFEYKEVLRRGVRFIPATSGKSGGGVAASARELGKTLKGMLMALDTLRRERPESIVSFGGYLAVPYVLMAYLLKIPIITHEQTIAPGKANIWMARFCRRVCVAFPQAANAFDARKTLVIGNPMRESITRQGQLPCEIDRTVPVIYVTGGSLGSHSINQHIMRLVPELTDRYSIIHQTGDIRSYGDYEEAVRLQGALTGNQKNRYAVFKHVEDAYIGSVYAACDIVVGRAGANTFFELLFLMKPSVLIPLPWSANAEQRRHAAYIAREGMGYVFEQNGPTEELAILIEKALQEKEELSKACGRVKKLFKWNASETLYALATDTK